MKTANPIRNIACKGGFFMSAVLGAFVQYVLTFAYFVAIAGAGIFLGKKLHAKKQAQKENTVNE